MSDNAGLKHPAKYASSRWFWHDRSEETETLQIIDLLHDIRTLLLILVFISLASCGG